MLADLLYSMHDQIGALNIFHYITVRASLSFITALTLCLWLGPKFISYLQKHQIGESIRDDGPKLHHVKKGTPTMGGVMILVTVIVSALLWNKWNNAFFLLSFVALIWMGFIGFIDDYIKVIKKDKKGLAGRFKIFGQISLGLGIGLIMSYSTVFDSKDTEVINLPLFGQITVNFVSVSIPFFKDLTMQFWHPVFYIFFVIFVLTALSNAVNLTDGLDGLAAGTSAISLLGFAGIAYVSGHVKLSEYLNIMFLNGSGEITVFAVSLIGATLGFLWYNAYPAQIFMGDTGSLALGSTIATMAILLHKEFWLLIVGAIFVAETVSVVVQTLYFKYTRKKFGEGKRVFLMAPFHHHYEKKGLHESKIVTRFWIIGILLLLVTLTTFKTQ